MEVNVGDVLRDRYGESLGLQVAQRLVSVITPVGAEIEGSARRWVVEALCDYQGNVCAPRRTKVMQGSLLNPRLWERQARK